MEAASAAHAQAEGREGCKRTLHFPSYFPVMQYGRNRELRETDQRLRAVFTNAPVFITVFEPDGTIVLLEGADKGTIAQETASLVGSRIYDLVPGYFAEELRANLERGLAGDSFTADMQWDGRDFQTRFAPLRDHDGSATGVIGVTTDESERLRATRELQRMNIDLTAAMERAEAAAREAEASRLRAEPAPLPGRRSRP